MVNVNTRHAREAKAPLKSFRVKVRGEYHPHAQIWLHRFCEVHSEVYLIPEFLRVEEGAEGPLPPFWPPTIPTDRIEIC